MDVIFDPARQGPPTPPAEDAIKDGDPKTVMQDVIETPAVTVWSISGPPGAARARPDPALEKVVGARRRVGW